MTTIRSSKFFNVFKSWQFALFILVLLVVGFVCAYYFKGLKVTGIKEDTFVPSIVSVTAYSSNPLLPIIASSQTEFQQTVQPFSIPLTQATIDKVYVDKSEQTLSLLQGSEVIKRYHIALGDNPQGHKQQEGDERTPEGTYTLDYKNEDSIAYRSIHVSYPNAADIANAKAQGVSPGGDIMIHGQMNGYSDLASVMQQRNWTDGCMAVTDNEMDEIMASVKVGTPIEIVW